MGLHQASQRGIGKDVDVMHKHRLVIFPYEPRRMKQRAAGVEQCRALVADADPQPEIAVGRKKLLYLVGKMMHIDYYLIKPLPFETQQHPLQHRNTTHRHQGLWMFKRERTKTGTETRRQYKCFHLY